MDIETRAVKVRKRIKKLTWDLTSGTAYSKTKRDEKEQEIKDLKQDLAALEKKLTKLRLTKMNIMCTN